VRRLLNAALAAVLLAPLAAAVAPATRVPVVVELFTSEGCSDCPPADALLAGLDRTQPVPGALVIPLEEHVDYWDHQGWRDPFSSHAITERQEKYAGQLRIASPYTPQMVVDGRTDLVGSASSEARAAIEAAARAPHVEVTLALANSAAAGEPLHATIRAGALPGEINEQTDAWLAVTEDGLSSKVAAGENAGRSLEHAAVVRSLATVGHVARGETLAAAADVRIAPIWKRENLRVVVFLSGAASGRIYGAATARLKP